MSSLTWELIGNLQQFWTPKPTMSNNFYHIMSIFVLILDLLTYPKIGRHYLTTPYRSCGKTIGHRFGLKFDLRMCDSYSIVNVIILVPIFTILCPFLC